MKFDVLEEMMREHEAILDERWPIDGFTVVRLDGRGFTKLTKELLEFERPFDSRFHSAIQQTCEHLMRSGIDTAFAYTQSDEISMLLRPEQNAFNRKTRKLNSILAGEASGVFSLAVGHPVAFDCRTIPVPDEGVVVDYFRWRAEDAKRNALTAYCYWTLRADGMDPIEADRRLTSVSKQEKLAILDSHNIAFSSQEEWKRLGALLNWKNVTVRGVNPLTREEVPAIRRRLHWAEEMPEGDALSSFVTQELAKLSVER